jgi:hypothetical protein
MRCYRTQDGRLVGTQREAGKGFVPVDVPRKDKDELLAFLNAERERGCPAPAVADAPDPDPAAVAPAAVAAVDLAEIIQEACPDALAACLESAVCRLGELGAKGGEALKARVGFPATRYGAGTAFYRGAAIINEVAAYS